MALFGSFGNLINAFAGGVSRLPGTVGAVGQIGSSFLSALAPARGPVVETAALPVAAPTGGRAQPVAVFGTSVMIRLVAPILVKIAQTLGRTSMTLRQAVKIIRRMSRMLGPLAIAGALGISAGELGNLLLASSQMPRRRMNPANTSALRRAARRIESFHRLCVRTDQLRSPRRRSSQRGRAHPPATTIVQAR